MKRSHFRENTFTVCLMGAIFASTVYLAVNRISPVTMYQSTCMLTLGCFLTACKINENTLLLVILLEAMLIAKT